MKAGHPKDAIDMYTKENMYEAAHKVHGTGFFFVSRLKVFKKNILFVVN